MDSSRRAQPTVRKRLLMPILITALVAAAAGAQAAAVDLERAAEKVDRGALVIDVRSADEVAQTGLLADAEHVPHTDTDALIAAIGPDLDRPVVVYCRTGFRSAIAIAELEAAGYTNLVNGGGYDELEAALEDV